MMKLGVLASSLVKSVLDTFSRTTAGSLGTSTSGASWSGLRGTWYANGSQAQSDDSASNYSLASVSIGTDTTTSASVSGGVGVAFWVSDAGSWWAAVPYNIQGQISNCTSGACSGSETYTYQDSTCSNGACSGTQTYSYTTSTCGNGACSGTYTYVTGSTCSNGACSGTQSSTISCSCTTQNVCETNYGTGTSKAGACVGSGGTYSSANGGTCCTLQQTSTCPNNACSGTYTTTTNCSCTYNTTNCSCTTYTGVQSCSCSTQTGTRYCSCSYSQAYRLRLLQSVGGSVSTATSDISLSSAPTAIKVITSGNTIIAQAYSDDGLTSTIGNALVYTPSSPTKGASTGLVKTPVDFNQGSTADNFSSGA